MREDASQLHGKAAEYAQVLREHLPELGERYGVESLGIFGPYVHGEQSKGSHLDLLVDFNRSIGLFDFVGLQEEISFKFQPPRLSGESVPQVGGGVSCRMAALRRPPEKLPRKHIPNRPQKSAQTSPQQ